jgi:hypothetical protein
VKAYYDRRPHGDPEWWFSAAWIARRFNVPAHLVDSSALSDDEVYADRWLG